jgi:hypothetical protein
VRTLAVAFLVLQAVGVLVWWAVMFLYPQAREPFKANGAPDSTLFGYLPADLVFFVGGALLAAYGLARREPWGWPVLCVVAGACAYAALYNWGIVLLGGGALFAALFITPSMVLLPLFAWLLRSGARA